ncbi:MAG: MTH938/NDUFAF3 family protein [Gammaproteobacteria bacterium]|nr:MTH938/NDUFAF3 family protein [Gammaproteobacteria bacterium]
MEIQLESPEQHAIRSYNDTSITVAGETLSHSCIVCEQGIQKDWPIQTLATLSIKDLEPLVRHAPKIILLGHNSKQQPNPEVISTLSTQRIGLECMSIGAACRTFNVLLGEKRAVVLGLILSAAPQ